MTRLLLALLLVGSLALAHDRDDDEDDHSATCACLCQNPLQIFVGATGGRNYEELRQLV